MGLITALVPAPYLMAARFAFAAVVLALFPAGCWYGQRKTDAAVEAAKRQINDARDARESAAAIALVTKAREVEAESARRMVVRAQDAHSATINALENAEHDRDELQRLLAQGGGKCRVSTRVVRVLDRQPAADRAAGVPGPAAAATGNTSSAVGGDPAGDGAGVEVGAILENYSRNRNIAYALTASNLEACIAAYNDARREAGEKQ